MRYCVKTSLRRHKWENQLSLLYSVDVISILFKRFNRDGIFYTKYYPMPVLLSRWTKIQQSTNTNLRMRISPSALPKAEFWSRPKKKENDARQFVDH